MTETTKSQIQNERGIETDRGASRTKSVLLLLGGLGVGYLAGIAGSPFSALRADVTEEPRRDAFKAGGVLNEPVLREISATLKRIETQAERIEKNTSRRASDNR